MDYSRKFASAGLVHGLGLDLTKMKKQAIFGFGKPVPGAPPSKAMNLRIPWSSMGWLAAAMALPTLWRGARGFARGITGAPEGGGILGFGGEEGGRLPESLRRYGKGTMGSEFGMSPEEEKYLRGSLMASALKRRQTRNLMDLIRAE